MSKPKRHRVPKNASSLRLNDYLIGQFEELPTRSSTKKAIKRGLVLINGNLASGSEFIKPEILIELHENRKKLKPYKLDLEIVHEDEHLAIVNKPAGLPTSGNRFRTLDNALVYNFSLPEESGYLHSPRPAHRLDSLTSGLVITAKTVRARRLIGKHFEDGKITKNYKALVMGKTPKKGVITQPVDNKPARTSYTAIGSVRSLQNERLTLLELKPQTGRTHQIRIHCAACGFPIYGDRLYSAQTIRGKGLFLAAVGLSFCHPVSGKNIDVQIPTPTKFESRMNAEEKRWLRHHE